MNDKAKIAVGVGVVLLIGFLTGYSTGSAGKDELKTQVEDRGSRIVALKQEVSRQVSEAAHQKAALRAKRRLFKAQIHVLQCLLQLHASNFGLASQHLFKAKGQLKAAAKGFDAAGKKKVEGLINRIAASNMMVLRLEPMAAKPKLQQLAKDIEALTGTK